MRVDDVRRRLTPIPERLPPVAREVIPIALGAGEVDVPRLPTLPPSEKQAAVLILIYPGPDGEARIVLIERASGDHRHAGQVGLPGGKIDATDESVVATALREAHEEVALDPQQAGVEIAGVLPVFDVRVSGFLVHPVVAFAEREPVLVPDGFEAVDILTAPISAFMPGAPIETVTAERDGFRLRYGGYQIGRHHVWGATAMMLSRLGAYLGAMESVPED
jgi:8-oxo-dGTP pyrophosphatase MutT (NUDIX family)